jgi:hypothetical protein
MVTLDDFTFPQGVVWNNRHGFSPLMQEHTQLLTGALLIEQSTMLSGRRIVIQTGQISDGYCGLFNLEELQALKVLFNDPADPERTLTIGNAVTFAVMFDRSQSEGGLEVEELVQVEAVSQWPDRIYRVTAAFVTTQAV